MAVALALCSAAACNQILGNQDGQTSEERSDAGGASSGTAASSGGIGSSSSGEAGASSSSGATDGQCRYGASDGLCNPPVLTKYELPTALSAVRFNRIALTEEFLFLQPATAGTKPWKVSLPRDNTLPSVEAIDVTHLRDAISTKPDLGVGIPNSMVFERKTNTDLQRCQWVGIESCGDVTNSAKTLVTASALGGAVFGRIEPTPSIWFTNGAAPEVLNSTSSNSPAEYVGVVLAANRDTVFYHYARANETAPAIKRATYPGIGPTSEHRTLNVTQPPVAMAANEEQLFVSPCDAARLCSFSLGTTDQSAENPRLLLTSTPPPAPIVRLFVDSSLLLFDTNGGDAYQCNATDCTAAVRIGTTVDSFTVNSRSLYVLIDGEIWSAERVPLHESR